MKGENVDGSIRGNVLGNRVLDHPHPTPHSLCTLLDSTGLENGIIPSEGFSQVSLPSESSDLR